MRIHLELTVEGSPLSPPRRPRTLVAIAGLAFALLLPAVVLASHQFSDVPDTHTFHANISNLAGAGVTAGCGGGKYCPDDPVTRGQMAGFLNRGLGTIAEAEFGDNFIGTDRKTVGSVTIKPGTSSAAVPGAKQFIQARFTGSVRFDDMDGCPCNLLVRLMRGTEQVNDHALVLTASTGGVYYAFDVGGAVAVIGSGAVPITLTTEIGFVTGGPATAYTVFGNLVAETFPFGNAISEP